MSGIAFAIAKRLHLYCFGGLVGPQRGMDFVNHVFFVCLYVVYASSKTKPKGFTARKTAATHFCRACTQCSNVFFDRLAGIGSNLDHGMWKSGLAPPYRYHLAVDQLWQNQFMGNHLFDRYVGLQGNICLSKQGSVFPEPG